MENSEFEIWSAFTNEIERWYDDAGGDPAHYDYVGNYDNQHSSLSAKLVVFSEDAEEVVEELNNTKSEFLGHLSLLFPQMRISVVAVTPAGWESTEESPITSEDAPCAFMSMSDLVSEDVENIQLDVSDEDYVIAGGLDDEDSPDFQYEEEGLTLIAADAEDIEGDFTDIIAQEDEALAEADDNEYAGGERFASDDARDYLTPPEDDLEELDEYIPDEQDREDLWRSFWVNEDE